MDFSLLPDPVFLQILEYLPLEDCFRAAHVNKIFRRMAQLAISGTKSLDLNEDRFQGLNADQFAVILHLCSPNLERFKLSSRAILRQSDDSGLTFTLDDQAQELAPIFPNYQCPRLTDIDLDIAKIDFTDFDRLVRNNPKMESLVWRARFVGFPNVTSDNLKKLNLLIDDDASLQSLIGRCPNLQEIDLNTNNNANTANVLDEFFASVPQLHRVNLHNVVTSNSATANSVRLESELVNFWNLSLTSLNLNFICYDHPVDNLLKKVTSSFPHLQKLYISCRMEPTDTGITYLGDLQELEEIELSFTNLIGLSNYDQGIRQLARCKKLRKFGICSSFISGGSFVHLLRNCSQLEYVGIFGIHDVSSSSEVTVILESLAGIPMRNIIINISSFDVSGCLWLAKPIRLAIRMLEENFGLKIKIDGPWSQHLQQIGSVG